MSSAPETTAWFEGNPQHLEARLRLGLTCRKRGLKAHRESSWLKSTRAAQEASRELPLADHCQVAAKIRRRKAKGQRNADHNTAARRNSPSSGREVTSKKEFQRFSFLYRFLSSLSHHRWVSSLLGLLMAAERAGLNLQVRRDLASQT